MNLRSGLARTVVKYRVVFTSKYPSYRDGRACAAGQRISPLRGCCQLHSAIGASQIKFPNVLIGMRNLTVQLAGRTVGDNDLRHIALKPIHELHCSKLRELLVSLAAKHNAITSGSKTTDIRIQQNGLWVFFRNKLSIWHDAFLQMSRRITVQVPYPTLPSKLTLSSFCASTANSIGSALKTSLQKPLTIMETASSVEMPRWRQ